MFFRFLALMCLVLSQSAFTFFNKPKPEPYTPQKKQLHVESFNDLSVKGDVDLNLRTGFSKPLIILRGDKRDINCLELVVENGVLQILVAKGYPKYGKISAEVRTRYLSSMEYHGDGTIVGNKLRANLVNLLIDNQGKTTLKGVIRLGRLEVMGNGYTEISDVTSPMLHVKLSDAAKLKLSGSARVRTIEMDGDSWFSLMWVKSTSLVVRIHDKAFLQLAGIVNKLDAKLTGDAQFSARYLRARRAFVKTCNNSVAEIAVADHQHTLATDSSDIRYFNLPEMHTNFMAFDGSALDMRPLNSPFIEEPTPYNKLGVHG